MQRPGDHSNDGQRKFQDTQPHGSPSRSLASASQPFPATTASRMLAASRVPQLPSSVTGERGISYADALRHGPPFPLMADNRPRTMDGSQLRLPSVSSLLNASPQLGAPPQFPPPPPRPLPPPLSALHSVATGSYVERPSTQERRYETGPSHVRTVSDSLVRPSSAYFANEAQQNPGREQAPMIGFITARATEATTFLQPYQSPTSGGTLSPRPMGTVPMPMQMAGQHTPQAQALWAASQSPQSSVSSVAPGAPGLAAGPRIDSRAVSTKRLLGEREVPGEGRVYVYDDGTRVPTVIDGEPVNGQWGMTKAGRPRKRMPQACIPCRQKKIKCDPGEGKCAQCEKTGKACQYSHGQRGKGNPTSPETAGMTMPNSPEEPIAMSPVQHDGSGDVVFRDIDRRESALGEGASRTRIKRPAISDDEGESWTMARTQKRQRVAAGLAAMEDLQREEQGSTSAWRSAPAVTAATAGEKRITVVSEAVVGYGCWAAGVLPQGFILEDPFAVEAEAGKADRYLEVYFDRINSGTFCVFPRTSFIAWAHSRRPKSKGELMVLYAMLANGALFDFDRPGEAKQDAERYMLLSRTAIETAKVRLGLLMVLARMLMGHTYVVTSDVDRLIEINDVGRAVSLLDYAQNERLERPGDDGFYDFGMNRHGLCELYQRTGWLAFLVDRFMATNLGHPLSISKESLFLRLPCDENDYDGGIPTKTAYFDNGIIARSFLEAGGTEAAQGRVSPWAYFIQGLSFHSDIWEAAMRARWQEPADYPGNCDAFARRMRYTVERWYDNLPDEVRLASDDVVSKCARDGTLGLFLAINALYHMSLMSLNRRVRTSLLPGSSIQPRVGAAMEHAERFLRKLKIVRARLADGRGGSRVSGGSSLWLTPVPFVRQAIMSAVDIMTACGHTGDMDDCNRVIDLCEAGVATMEQLMTLYSTCRVQYQRMVARMRELRELVFSRPGERNEIRAWCCRHPLESMPPDNMDLFYKANGGVTDFVLNEREVDPHRMTVVEMQTSESVGGKSTWGEAADWGIRRQ